jgi:hypothetical protein
MRIACVCEQPREDSLSVLRQRSGQRLGIVFPWRWSVEDAGVGEGARIGHPDAGVFIALACQGRWRCEGSQNRLPRRWRFHCAGVLIALACQGRWRWEGSQNRSP